MQFDFQYISQGKNPEEHLSNIHDVLEAGGKWIQLRIKESDIDVIEEFAYKTKQLCEKYKATFILNDHFQLAIKLGLDGVHVGLKDESVRNIRKIAGTKFIIGGTANTFEDIFKHYNQGANYVGLGPFRFTTTKKKLSPVLGIDGYKKIVTNCQEQNINIPIIAIGGIKYDDFEDLYKTGVNGLAISGQLTKSIRKKELIIKANQLFKIRNSISIS